MSDDEAPEYGLVMPFVTVVSVGGPHDDASYVAGWEMGQLAGLLEHGKPPIHDQPIRAESAEQADLVAMQHGYHAEVTESPDIKLGGVDGWRHLRLTRLDLADGVVQ